MGKTPRRLWADAVSVDIVDKIRAARRMTISEFTRRIGCDRTKMHHVKAGTSHFTKDEVERMAQVLNVPISALLDEKSAEDFLQNSYKNISIHIGKGEDGRPKVTVGTVDGDKIITSDEIKIFFDDYFM